MCSIGCPEDKRSDILSCLAKRNKRRGWQDEMQLLKATHFANTEALRSQHVVRLHTVLCCLQLAASKKPYLPESLTHNKEEYAYKYAPHNLRREQLFSFVKAARQS